MQPDPRGFPGCPVKELGGQVFHQDGIVSLLLPSGYQVIVFFLDQSEHFRDFLRVVLEVCIHGDYPIPGGRFKPRVKRLGLPEILQGNESLGPLHVLPIIP